MLLAIIVLLIGFILLVKGADYFVEGSSSVAKLLRVPSIIIGLTVVAFGTSMPEASVSITASLKGANDLAISNVIGSNIFNLLVVLGTCALFAPIKTKSSILKKEFPFSIIVSVILLELTIGTSYKTVLQNTGSYTLSRISGIILLGLFVYFLVSTVRDALRSRNELPEEEYKTLSPLKSALFILVGLAGIIIGGNMVVSGASDIAAALGFSQTFIGLTIVALGTSLPELVTSVVAATKGENDLAVGNVIGSNIFNILLIIGSSATIVPIAVDVTAIYDTAILIVVSTIAYLLNLRKKKIAKKEGILFLAMYVAFFIYILVR